MVDLESPIESLQLTYNTMESTDEVLCQTSSNWHQLIPSPSDYHLEINGGSSALFSPCNQYRLVLERRLNSTTTTTSSRNRAILWIGMNPSTADAFADDPTVRRETAFSAQWGYDRYLKVNVCDYRATDPEALKKATDEPRSAVNLDLIRHIAQVEKPEVIVLCCGVLPKKLQWMARQTIVQLGGDDGHRLFCLGLTEAGWPKHPLYLRKDCPLIPYPLALVLKG